MKFRLFSDLHLESKKKHLNDIFNILNRFNEINPVENLILAGDITTYKNIHLLKKFIDNSPNYHRIFYVLGNHEYDGGGSLQDYKNHIAEINRQHNKKIILLENQKYHITPDLCIVGTTLWTENNSFKPARRVNEIARKFIENLSEDKQYLVITHHMPSKKLINPRYKDVNSDNYASDSDYLFTNKITHWVYGHTHTRNIGRINNTLFFCNPMGHLSENKEYEDFVIEIKQRSKL